MRVLVLGYGKIGATIADMLSESGDYSITIGEASVTAVQAAQAQGYSAVQVDVTNLLSLDNALSGQDAVINALPHHLVQLIASACAKLNINYFDLTEDVASARFIKEHSAQANCLFAPQCGLAPGFISIAASHLLKKFDRLRDIGLRVGALPIYPTNELKYNLTWSTDGLINEYCMPCEAIHEGRLIETLPLEGYETFALDGVNYECFNTSGGIGTLCHSLQGQAETVNYKTIRYVGHRDIMAMLLRDLRMSGKREQLKAILEDALPITLQDEVITLVTATGYRDGLLTQESFLRKVYARTIKGVERSAIQVTTAAAICAALDLFRTKAIQQQGMLKQEDIPLELFLKNRFGQYYA
jgi:saccharopine dehydrogenase-like NADP-dependent oxidoreductase